MVRIERAWPVKHEGSVCSSWGAMRCLPCLSKPVKLGAVYRTRDGAHLVRIEEVGEPRRSLEPRWRWESPVKGVLLDAAGAPVPGAVYGFGLNGECLWPRNASSPTDLVAEVPA